MRNLPLPLVEGGKEGEEFAADGLQTLDYLMAAVEVVAVVADVVARGVNLKAALMDQEADKVQQFDVAGRIEALARAGAPRPQFGEFLFPEAQGARRNAEKFRDIRYAVVNLSQ